MSNEFVMVSRELLNRAVELPTKNSLEENHAAIVDRGRAQAEIRAILTNPAARQGEPVLYYKPLVGAEAKPTGECYSVFFTPMPGHQPLFASAEPSAPKCTYCGDTGQIMVGRSGDANDGNAPIMEPCEDCDGPSAPVEIDERAEFVEAWNKRGIDPVEAILIPSLTDDSFANVRARDAYWGWKARAVLERKPS